MGQNSVEVTSSQAKGNVDVTNNMAQYWAEKSREWAVSENTVSGEDNSSKWYANKSKEYKENAQSAVSGFNSTVENATTDFNTLANSAKSDIVDLTGDFSDLYEEKSEALQSEYTSYSNSLESEKDAAITGIIGIATTALNNITTAENTAVSDIETEAQEQITNIKSTGFFMEDDKLYYIDDEGNKQEFKSGGGVMNYGMSLYAIADPQNSGLLKSLGQKNSGEIYKGIWNSYLTKKDEDNNIVINTDIENIKDINDETATDYDFKVDLENKEFILPTLNGSETLPTSNVVYNIFNSTITSTHQTYTVPANGFIGIMGHIDNAGTWYVLKNSILVNYMGVASTNNSSAYFEVNRGDTITVYTNSATLSNVTSYFEKANGNGDLYYYVGDSVRDEGEIDIANVLDELTTKTNLEQAANASMPSIKYINLTVGASGSVYTAPADGWVQFSTFNCSRSGYQAIYSGYLSTESRVTINGTACQLFLPVPKGFSFSVAYDIEGVRTLRFIYAKGVQ